MVLSVAGLYIYCSNLSRHESDPILIGPFKKGIECGGHKVLETFLNNGGGRGFGFKLCKIQMLLA